MLTLNTSSSQKEKKSQPQNPKQQQKKPTNNLHILQYFPGMKSVTQNKRTVNHTYTYYEIYFHMS